MKHKLSITEFIVSHELYDPLRIFKPLESDLRVVAEYENASIAVDGATGTIVFRVGRYGIAYNPKVNAWSAPLDFEEQP